jgi:hypothetical protein
MNKTKYQYEVDVPVSTRFIVERDEDMTEEELWESVTKEEMLKSIRNPIEQHEAIYSWKNLGIDDGVTVYKFD